MRKKKPTVLIITYYYPPIDVIGAQRPLSLVKYLPDFGYDVNVLTTNRHGVIINEDRSSIHRASEPYGYLIKPFRDILLRAVPSARRAAARVLSHESRLALFQNRLLIPDQAITWVPFAVRLGIMLRKHSQFDLIISTSPTESAHLVAYLLKKKFNVPWIADFRDGWLFEPLKPKECYQGLQGRLMQSLERRVVTTADIIVAVTPPISNDFCDRYPVVASKVHTITNGYDEAEINQLRCSKSEDGIFNIVYTGALGLSRPDRSAMPFFLALANIIGANKGKIRDHLSVLFIGDFTDQEKLQVSQLGLNQWVEFRQSVPRLEALEIQANADVLLLITEPHRKGVATAKLFDYIGVRKPILALAQGDTAGEMIKKLNIGYVVDHQNVDEINDAISDLHSAWLAGTLKLAGTPPPEYGRHFQAGVMANLLNTLC